jgi:hypothetical protein
MRLYCQACLATFEGHFLCPKCGRQLVPPPASGSGKSTPPPPAASLPATESAAAALPVRLLIAVLLAAGFAAGGQQLAAAALASQGMPLTAVAWPVTAAVFAAAAAAGAFVGGAGHPLGAVLGLVVGALNVVLLLALRAQGGVPPLTFDEWPGPAALVGLPLAGLLGGALGRLVWPPLPPLPRLTAPAATPRGAGGPPVPGVLSDRPMRKPPAPWAWERLVAGAILGIAAAAGAHVVRDALPPALAGYDRSQAPFVAWQIAMLGVFLGGAVAGCGTRRGVSQGAVAGLLTIAGFGAAQVATGNDALPTLAGAGLAFNVTDTTLPVLMGTCFAPAALAAAVVGGWFGGLLLPPLVPERPRITAREV